jgi:hypothetical protein
MSSLLVPGVVLACLLTLSSGCISISFTGFPKPDRPFSADVFMLDESDFPPGSRAEPIAIDSEEDGAGEHLIRTTYLPGGGLTVQTLRGYGSEDRAAREFQRTLKGVFGRGPHDVEWVVPEELQHYQSPIADQFRIGCGTIGTEYCRVSAQYAEYYVRLSIDVRPPTTYTDVERMLQALDARFAAKLKEVDSVPTP